MKMFFKFSDKEDWNIQHKEEEKKILFYFNENFVQTV